MVTFKFALFPLNFGYLSAPSTRFSETPAKDALSHVLIVYWKWPCVLYIVKFQISYFLND